MTDQATTTPTPPEALREYAQLADWARTLTPDELRHLQATERQTTKRRRDRRRYIAAVNAAGQAAVESGRITPSGETWHVHGAPGLYHDLDTLIIDDPDGGEPLAGLVEWALVILTADLLDGADVETVTSWWSAAMTDTEPAPAPLPRQRQATPSQPTAAPRPARKPRNPARAAKRRGVLSLIAAALCMALAPHLLGRASAGDVPAWTAGVAAVAMVAFLAAGLVNLRAASRRNARR